MRKFLIIDGHNLMFRNHHALRQLRFEGRSTGATFGFLRDVLALQEMHGTERVAFCFDAPRATLLRKEFYPTYKASRDANHQEQSQNERNEFKGLRRQIRDLWKTHLPSVGFRNVFREEGYEADDLIASLVINSLKPADEAVLISSDKDLLQLLRPKVCIWNPYARKIVSDKTFTQQWGIGPSQWPNVKALAGCSSDDVEGIKGVGELTAAKWLKGLVKEGSSVEKKLKEGESVWKRNLKLVRLPWEGCPTFKLRKDEFSAEAWKKLTRELGMKSLENKGAEKQGVLY